MLLTINKLHLLPETPGIYQFLNTTKEIIYIGKAKNLKKRVSSYFQKKYFQENKTAHLRKHVKFIKEIQVLYEFEALLLEAKLIKKHKPKYNVIWKDDKHYIYLQITRETFPRILLTRKIENGNRGVFGPFPSARTLRDILMQIRKIFPFCTQKPSLKRACFYTHIGLCNPCPAQIKKLNGDKYVNLRKTYFKNIQQIRNLLNGKTEGVKKYLKKEMQKLSGQNLFEHAAKLRDKLYSLDYLMKRYYPTDFYVSNSQFINKIRVMERNELENLLKDYYPNLSQIRRIECYDVSNTSGKLAVGSMVTFIGGVPDKNFYRRFRMKLQNKINDFAMMAEMLKRRLKHRDWGVPDLLVVDGGTPQCRTIKGVLSELSISIPFIGIAKEDEALVVPKNSQFKRIILPKDSSALQLIQRIRDEAHRFAHSYHTLLRLKSLFE